MNQDQGRPVYDFIGPDGESRIVRQHRPGCTCDECVQYRQDQTWQQLERRLSAGEQHSQPGEGMQ